MLIINENKYQGHQNESTAKIYMNRFSIEEDDQFEIHVNDFTDKYFIDGEDIYNVAEEVFLNEEVEQQGMGFFSSTFLSLTFFVYYRYIQKFK